VSAAFDASVTHVIANTDAVTCVQEVRATVSVIAAAVWRFARFYSSLSFSHL
jgi:hypothetical protein